MIHAYFRNKKILLKWKKVLIICEKNTSLFVKKEFKVLAMLAVHL